MCWLSNKLKKCVAPANFITYKVMKPVEDGVARASVFDRYIYRQGKPNPTVSINPYYEERYGGYVIEEGYHSFTEIPSLDSISSYSAIYRVMVPKGAIYYKSDIRKEIVSTDLIMCERISYGNTLKNVTLSERLHYLWTQFKTLFSV